MINFQSMMLARSKILGIISIPLFLLSTCANPGGPSEEKFLVIKEEYFATHFMVGLDTIDLEFNGNLSPTFQLIATERDWKDLETDNGENLNELIKRIKSKGELANVGYTYVEKEDLNHKDLTYECGCSNAYLMEDYALIYCEMILSQREKFTFNFLFKDEALIFHDGSGVLLVNQN